MRMWCLLCVVNESLNNLLNRHNKLNQQQELHIVQCSVQMNECWLKVPLNGHKWPLLEYEFHKDRKKYTSVKNMTLIKKLKQCCTSDNDPVFYYICSKIEIRSWLKKAISRNDC